MCGCVTGVYERVGVLQVYMSVWVCYRCLSACACVTGVYERVVVLQVYMSVWVRCRCI